MSGSACQLVVETDQAVLHVTGEIDISSAENLRAVGVAALSDGITALALDLSGVTFMDSTGIGALVHLHNLASARGTTLRVQDVSAQVRRLLELTGLAGQFELPVGESETV